MQLPKEQQDFIREWKALHPPPELQDNSTIEDRLRDSVFRWRLTAGFFIVLSAVAIYRGYKPIEEPRPLTIEELDAKYPIRAEDFAAEVPQQSPGISERSSDDPTAPDHK